MHSVVDYFALIWTLKCIALHLRLTLPSLVSIVVHPHPPPYSCLLCWLTAAAWGQLLCRLAAAGSAWGHVCSSPPTNILAGACSTAAGSGWTASSACL